MSTKVLTIFQGRDNPECKTLRHAIEFHTFADIELQFLDVEDIPEYITEYKIRDVPTMILFEDGEEVKRYEGSATIDSLLAWLE